MEELIHYAITTLGGGEMLCLVGVEGEKLIFHRKKSKDNIKNRKQKSRNNIIGTLLR